MTRLSEQSVFDVELVDLREHELPFFDGEAPARIGRDVRERCRGSLR